MADGDSGARLSLRGLLASGKRAAAGVRDALQDLADDDDDDERDDEASGAEDDDGVVASLFRSRAEVRNGGIDKSAADRTIRADAAAPQALPELHRLVESQAQPPLSESALAALDAKPSSAADAFTPADEVEARAATERATEAHEATAERVADPMAPEQATAIAAAVDAAVRRAERRLLGEWSGLQFAVESALSAELAALEEELSIEREMRLAVCAREASWAAANDRLRLEAAQRDADAAVREAERGEALRAELVRLRDKVGAQAAQLQERERLLDDLAAAAEQGDAVTWRARAELAQSEVSQLKARLRAMAAEHEPQLQRATAERDEATATAQALAQQLEEARAVARGAEGQLSRLSGALQLHVAEADELAAKLREAHSRLALSVDRQVARSWVVTFVENYASRSSSHQGYARQRELLEMMAAWWSFSAEDRIRVGLAETTDALHTPNESLGERWTKFLHREADGIDGALANGSPAPRLDRSASAAGAARLGG